VLEDAVVWLDRHIHDCPRPARTIFVGEVLASSTRPPSARSSTEPRLPLACGLIA
jgi:hypothetical protein